MKLIRHLLQTRSLWFVALFTLALAMKALVPHGYMISADSQTMTVKICNGVGDTESTVTIPMGTDGSDHDNGSNMTGKACSSSSVSQSAMTVTDPVQLAIALGFILLAGLLVRTAMPSERLTRLRPPLRGPPASA
ncbi:DUF2946 family protein [Parasphingorhabdus cellanae]|uniref:DUF2946 domain-containing protein n=1 Tax=Parasphingorhabdus cellanae TaxID=2806553 RepID=A0ABX7T3F0_9SPHN|nr:hypothetical protein [Parasphingorhabdus cellanae]QTD56089.1 hypothetical protein J4G78_00300 [Parasphingorhabdus cellanae]